ncbi:hypothetical protein ScalyP_jg5127 [Parmales sp. scaly parma]|nr:hypothetical protein ScalyP_jg5127 [Parmales sp. scaly parma]
MKAFENAHKEIGDPFRMAIDYMEIDAAAPDSRSYDNQRNLVENLKGGNADKNSPASWSLCVDLKRCSPTPLSNGFRCEFSDAGSVANYFHETHGASAVFANIDSAAYNCNLDDLDSVIAARARANPKPGKKLYSVIMKDIIVSRLQIALAKVHKADAVLLIACVLQEKLEEFMNLCTLVNMPFIVECHTPEEVGVAIENGAGIILVNRVDRVTGILHENQGEAIINKMFPNKGAGGFVLLATGGIRGIEEARDLLSIGYDGVVLGKAVVGVSHEKVEKLAKSIVDGGGDFNLDEASEWE